MEELYIAPEFVEHLKDNPADEAFKAEVGHVGLLRTPICVPAWSACVCMDACAWMCVCGGWPCVRWFL
jgi:hypothetical protein